MEDALASFAEVDFVVPVPRPRPQVSAREAFLYLVTFAALYVSAWHFGNLLFQFVNLAFPDPLQDLADYARQRIRFSTAALVVAFPVFLYLSIRIERDMNAEPARRASAVRRWVTHLTLALAAVVVLGDLVSLVYGLLSGGLTARFLLKSAVVAAIAGAIFGYYLWSARADDAAVDR